MIYAIEYLTQALQRARKGKRLSQRALSQKVGMPQAQISKIENAAVDLKVSSLIALARALDLEVVLVPRQLLSAVTHLVSLSEKPESDAQRQKPVYRLDEQGEDGDE